MDSNSYQPRWLFWVTFWYLLVASLYLVMGMVIIILGTQLIHHRRIVYRSVLPFYRRLWGRSRNSIQRWIMMYTPIVLALLVMTLAVAWTANGDRTRATLPALGAWTVGFVVLALLQWYHHHLEVRRRENCGRGMVNPDSHLSSRL